MIKDDNDTTLHRSNTAKKIKYQKAHNHGSAVIKMTAYSKNSQTDRSGG